MYEELAEVEEGEKVIFNGYFRLHDGILTKNYFLDTRNLTEHGTLTDPDFGFTFTEFILKN
jgi:hypothetical protein